MQMVRSDASKGLLRYILDWRGVDVRLRPNATLQTDISNSRK
jgi:hypothetical protein